MGALSRAYLALYNVAAAAGWAYALYLAALAAAGGGLSDVYASAGSTVVLLQSAALLETVHAGVGLVRGSPVNAFLNWAGRTHVLLALADRLPQLQTLPATGVMLGAWALTEVIRYPQYAFAVFDAAPAWLTWLRYTIFIPLYPVGAGAEVALMVAAIQGALPAGLYDVSMPNALNFGFNYRGFLIALVAAYPFLWWGLYAHMLRQRHKKLAPAPRRKRE